MAKVLVLGSGCREHALAWKLSQSEKVKEIIVATGNAGTESSNIRREADLNIKNPNLVAQYAKSNGIDIVIVGPEDPLNRGVTDSLRALDIPCFGPSKDAAQIECDKTFAKNFMKRHSIPTAQFASFTDSKSAIEFVESCNWSGIVVKAAGLAAGKGVVVAETKQVAIDHIKQVLDEKIFGETSIVIEEKLLGYEVSVLAFTDGKSYKIMPPSQDHKRALDNDEGANTGGMGAFCPVYVDEQIMKQVEDTVIRRAINGLRSEGKTFVGVLYAGIMVTVSGINVLEYNCRFGDPETQVILPLLNTDLYEIMVSCTNGSLDKLDVQWKTTESTCGVVLASENYPAAPIVGRTVSNIPPDVLVFHGGTKKSGSEILSSGGRVLTVVSVSKTLKEASQNALKAVSQIRLEGSFYRKDIAQKELRRLEKKSLTYKSSGVDIEAGEQLVDRIKKLALVTQRPGVMDNLGGFGALFDLKSAGYEDPILVSGTDGVGTKLRVALECGKFDTVGIDLVAMCVNDILVQGAEPLFFLDYFACGSLDVDLAAKVIEGISAGCVESNCALVGGETAEMPSMYHGKDFDLAGFAVGALDRKNILPKLQEMKAGDLLIGLPSSGVHSNGFSLIRKLISNLSLSFSDIAPFDHDVTLGESLLKPTTIYVKTLLPIVRAGLIRGMAHITGGGLIHNVPRVLPDHLSAYIDATSFEIPSVFSWIQKAGNVSNEDMLATFNNGIGMVCIVDQKDADTSLKMIQSNGEPNASIIGKLVERTSEAVTVANFNPQTVKQSISVPKRKRTAVLISGSGTNLQALINRCKDKKFPAEIVLVISNIPNVAGLDRAKKAGIETMVISHVGKKRVTFDMQVHKVLVEKNIEIVCLAGFMRIVSKEFVELWEGRLLNIHPSLLPSFPGMHTHEEVLKAGVRVHGCTIHFVDAGVDTGGIILQEAVAVLPGDTAETLRERVQVQAEHRTYARALELVAGERVALDTGSKRVLWK